MHKSKSLEFISLMLVLLLLFVGGTIIFLGVPLLAEDSFGMAANNLTPTQKWTYSFRLLINKQKIHTPVSMIENEFTFSIPSGASVTSVAQQLEQNGLINEWEAFRYYVIYKGLDTQIKAGAFQLSPSMTAIEIAEVIQSTFSKQVSFYIYPGWRAEEIAEALPSSGIEVSPDDFLQVVLNPSSLTLPGNFQGIVSLEGFLFPGTYTIDRQISAQELALTFVNRFNEMVTPEVQTRLQSNGLSFHEAITLASIIQRETFDDNERALMASVFFNRLANGMKLETDPTVQYSLGKNESWSGWWKTPLSMNDLKVNSPFNTYVIQGLPPTPISNPDLPSIMAVANPETSSYFYFRANCDGSGSHVFSATFEEHLNYTCE